MKKKIAVLATGWAPDILHQYVSGICEGFEGIPTDVYLFMCNAALEDTPAYIRGELNIYNLPDFKDFDAAMLFANGLDFPGLLDEIAGRCKAANIPAVYTGNKREDGYFVGSDNEVGTRQLCEHLMDEHGVTDIWFVAGSDGNMDSNTRLRVFKEMFAQRGHAIKEENIVYTDWTPAVATNYVRDRLKGGSELPQAIVCANDALAMQLSLDLNAMGYKVPEDVIITGFDHEYTAQAFYPSICSVDQRFDLIGKECARTVLKLWDGRLCEREMMIPCEAFFGESCGCMQEKKFSMIRKELGCNRFEDTEGDVVFDRALSSFEHGFMDVEQDLKLEECFQALRVGSNPFARDTFHILVDPLLELSIYDQSVKLRTEGYSNRMDVVYSCRNGISLSFSGFETRLLVPLAEERDEGNHFYLFLPLQEGGKGLGYIVFCDDLGKLRHMNRVRRYVERVNVVLGRYLRDRRVAVLHKRLLDMTKTDALTRVKNRTAYEEREELLQSKMNKEENCHFAIAIFDINNLKMFNDQLGHEAGDAYIQASCRLICKIFKRSAVYRIGGDEFVAVLENEDYNDREHLFEELTAAMEKLKGEDILPQEKVSVAAGCSEYNSSTDKLVSDIFSRADGKMYENKMLMKGMR